MVLGFALRAAGQRNGLDHYVVVFGKTLYFHIAIRVGLASYPEPED